MLASIPNTHHSEKNYELSLLIGLLLFINSFKDYVQKRIPIHCVVHPCFLNLIFVVLSMSKLPRIYVIAYVEENQQPVMTNRTN